MDTSGVTRGSDQSGEDFYGADFGESRSLQGVVFRGANLARTSFSRGYLDPTEVHTKHHLENLLYSSNLSRCDFRNANLAGANLFGCVLSLAVLTNANAAEAVFSRAKMEGIQGDGGGFKGAKFSGAILDNSSFVGASFAGAMFGSQTLGSASKYEGEAVIGPASLRNCNLTAADFSQCELSGVDFTGAILDDAEFNGAILNGAIMPSRWYS